MLEVDVVVYAPDEEEDDGGGDYGDNEDLSGDDDDDDDGRIPPTSNGGGGGGGRRSGAAAARLTLVRMVNSTPLLDGAEAAACGVVRAVPTARSWSSFGLEVSPAAVGAPLSYKSLSKSKSPHPEPSRKGGRPFGLGGGGGGAPGYKAPRALPPDLHIPSYEVRDSVQVAPFFRSGTHDLFDPLGDGYDPRGGGGGGGGGQLQHGEEEDGSGIGSESEGEFDGRKRRGKERRERECVKRRSRPLPAGLRIGNVLIVAQIRATPSALPLPTLSKVRGPLKRPTNPHAEGGGGRGNIYQPRTISFSPSLKTD